MKPPSMKPEDRDELCQSLVLALLKNLLVARRNKVDAVTWRALGGPEAVDLLHALETGGSHPVLEEWRRLRRIYANRSGSLLDQTIRHTAVLMVEALCRADLGKDAARERAAEALQRVLPTTTKRTIKSIKRTIKYWQDNHSISAEDERLIAQAIEYHGHDHDRLVKHFVGLIGWADTAVAAWTVVRHTPPDGQ